MNTDLRKLKSRTVTVTRTIGEFTYTLSDLVEYDRTNRNQAYAVIEQSIKALEMTLKACTAEQAEACFKTANDTSQYKKPASEARGNLPAGVTFDPQSPIFEVTDLDIVVSKGTRYVKALTEKVHEHGFPVWPDFPYKDPDNTWSQLSRHTGIDLAHCEPNLYKLDANQRFGIQLGKAKSMGKEVSKIMAYHFDWKPTE